MGSCGYIEYIDGTYFPLDGCISYMGISLSFTCSNQQPVMIDYSEADCQGIPLQNPLYGYYNYQCNSSEICDYVQYGMYPADINGIDCSSIGDAPISFQVLINHCYYDRTKGKFRMDTCTDTIYNNFYYDDDKCSGVLSRAESLQIIDECNHGSTNQYTTVQECTAPMNHISNECGYVQRKRSYLIEPLDECITSTALSFLLTCNGSTPFVYYWHDNSCGDFATADGNFGVAAASFSCSTNKCSQATLQTYPTNNCQTITPDVVSTSRTYITNTCFNWFDSNNTMLSEIYHCFQDRNGQTWLYGVGYNKPDCDGSDGSFIIVNYTDQCVLTDTSRYIIQCDNVSLTAAPTASPTAPIRVTTTSTLTTTAESTISTIHTTSFGTSQATPSPTLKNERVYYVSSSGEDLLCSATETVPCGTLREAVSTASNAVGYHNVSRVEIIVQGQNPADIKAFADKHGGNPCIPATFDADLTYFSEITITFDPDYINEMKDWYATDLCESGYRSTLTTHGFFAQRATPLFGITINNMIFDSYVFEGRSVQPFYIANMHAFTCNNCVFSNITISSDHHTLDEYTSTLDHAQFPSLMSVSIVELINCEFHNIVYTANSDGDGYNYSFLHINTLFTNTQEGKELFSLTMTNDIITGISKLNRFIDIYMFAALSTNTPSGQFSIDNTTFDGIFVFDTIFYHNSDNQGGVTYFDISNSNVLNVNVGSILHMLEDKSFVTLSNVNISTPQTIQKYIETKELYGITSDDYYSLFIFESKIDIITISDVNIEFYYGHYLGQNCESDHHEYWMLAWNFMEKALGKDLDFLYFKFFCAVPIQFLHSFGTVAINHLTVSNDITDILVADYKSFFIDKARTDPFYSKDTIYIDLMYKYNSEDTGFIYNDGGKLTIEDFYVYGLGVHEYIIFNPNGDLSVTRMKSIPETYCTDTPWPCNKDALRIGTWIRFSAGSGDSNCYNNELRLSDSYLYGSETQSIVVGAGYAYIHNTTIESAGIGISTDTDCMYLEIISCELIDIGPYYSSSGLFLMAYSELRIPFVLVSAELLIKDTLFSYVAPYQFSMFGSEWWFDILAEADSDERKITLINNVFEINDENVVRPYPTNQTLHYLEELDWQRAESDENYTVDIDLTKYFVVDGVMEVRDNIDMTMINNEFRVNENNSYVTDTVLMDVGIAWIYIENYNGSVCLSGNEFTNHALYVHSGNVTSCVKPQLIEYFDVGDCDSYGTFGSISDAALVYNQRQPNIFNINNNNMTSIVVADFDSYIGLDNNIVRIQKQLNHTDILHIVDGNYLFVDTIINTTTSHDIIINEDCDVVCYSVVDNDLHLVSTLHVVCDVESNNSYNNTVSINEISGLQYKSYWSPYWIEIVAQNDGLYIPGNKLLLNYSIYDEYYNKIDAVNWEFIINFEFKSINSEELFLISSFQILINSDGECPQCRNGISFSAVTLDLLNQTYSFTGSVANNYIIIEDPFSITVGRCPSGFGASGTNQCDICARGYFNLLPTTNACYYCNENEIDGITCPGKDSIVIEYNYWIMVYQFSAVDGDIFGAEYIVSSKCPGQYCCQQTNGCDLLYDLEFVCAENRDFNTALCGQCITGFSEVYGTAKCMICDVTYVLRLLVPILYGLFWALFILISKTSKKKNMESNNSKCSSCKSCFSTEKLKTLCCCKCCSNKPENGTVDLENNKLQKKLTKDEYLNSLEIMVSKIMLYYYQSISYIFTTSEIKSSLYGFVQLSNLNIFLFISFDDDSDGYCLLKNMTAPQKISLQLITTVSILLFIFITYLCSLSNCAKNLNFQIHFPQCFVAAMLICVGQILSVLFQLLACREITPQIAVHFFFGSHECYEIIWLLSIISLCVVIFSFFILFLIIYIVDRRKEDNDDLDKTTFYYYVIYCYKPSHWYWELVLFLRRLIFAFVFIVFDNKNLKMSMGILLVIYLYIHAFSIPFKWKDANMLEAYLIGAAAVIVFIDINQSSLNVSYRDVVLSILILFPLIWYLYFMISRCKSLGNTDSKNSNINMYQPVPAGGNSQGNVHIAMGKEVGVEMCANPLNTMKYQLQTSEVEEVEDDEEVEEDEEVKEVEVDEDNNKLEEMYQDELDGVPNLEKYKSLKL